MKYVLTCVLLLLVAGCGEEFAAGVASGVATAKAISDDSQDRFIAMAHELDAKTEEMRVTKEAVGSLAPKDFIRPETIEAIEGLKDRTKDPVTWLALLSLLGNGVWAGRAVEKRIVK